MMETSGRLTLEISVLDNLSVYWLSLSKIPKSILQTIQRKTFNFIWSGDGGKHKFHLVHWENPARPNQMGGWSLWQK